MKLTKVLTEKAAWRATRHNDYTFEVPLAASKGEIANAVEQQFNVTVRSVRTIRRQSAQARFRQHRFQLAERKLAIVGIALDQKIAIYE